MIEHDLQPYRQTPPLTSSVMSERRIIKASQSLTKAHLSFMELGVRSTAEVIDMPSASGSLSREEILRRGRLNHLGRRYDTTEVSDRITPAKNILSGKTADGKQVEIPEADIIADTKGALVYRRDDNGKYFRLNSAKLCYDFEMPACEGGVYKNPPGIAVAMMMAAFMPGAFPLNLYPMNDVDPRYIAQASEFFRKHMGIQWATDDNILVGYGSNDVVNMSLSVMLNGKSGSDEREYILSQRNEYHPYSRTSEKWGGKIIHLESLSKENLEQWWEENPDKHSQLRGIFFTNPVGPTGKIYSLEELEGIADFAKEKNLYVLVDQVYGNLIFDPEKSNYVSMASLQGMESRTITTWSPSKDLGAVSIRQGFACVPADFAQKMYVAAEFSTLTQGTINQAMGMKALEMIGSPQHEAIRKEAQTRVQLILQNIATLNTALNSVVRERNPRLYESLPKDKNGNAVFISVPEKPEAGYAMMLRFHNLEGMVDRHNTSFKNSLDITGFLMDYGIPFSPLYSSGNDGMDVKFCFGQFGERAYMGPYMRETVREAAEKGITIDPSKVKLSDPDPKYKHIETYEQANEVAHALLNKCFKQVFFGLADIYTNQHRWKLRQQDIESPKLMARL